MASNSNDVQQPEPLALHILFFPYIAPGHLIPAADMAALFASRGVKCTILTTPVNAAVIRSAVDRANDAAAATRGPAGGGALAIQISTVPFPDVGLPPGVESATGISPGTDDVDRLMEAHRLLREPFGRFLADHRPDAVVADSFYEWAADAAAEHGVPRLTFLGASLFARACVDSLLRHNPFELAPDDDDDPDAVASLPALPHRVEFRRGQVMDPRKNRLEWEHHQAVNAADQRSYGEVFNSFADLEPDYVDHYRTTLGRRVWLVGPLAYHAGSRMAPGAPDAETCLRWLDEKPGGSVVYVSFGTLSRLAAAELRELARGLQLSGKNFVWVLRGGASSGSEEEEEEDASPWMPGGFAELIAVGGRGLVLRSWAPQRLILNHSAVGGFLTHCGWNSVLEAVGAGVPLVTWPRHADQFCNEKLVVEVHGIGVGVGAGDYDSNILDKRREVIGGEKIAEAIGRVMGDGEEAGAIRRKAKELGGKARSAAEEGGSSYEDVGNLISELMSRRRSVGA
ncbi:hypothetical protein U9M48_037482 [Paspalum notatum var. saurae]|uniref:Glycosyltransferase n=1 Tax=Paspalum notatum var. saurae TaxID=547442 RepID=A0AAQ3UJU0_PASNO